MTKIATTKDMQGNLPAGWRWVRLGDVCQINPRRGGISRSDEAPTSFVPMEAVDADKGIIDGIRERPFSDVKKGYTFFEEGDVLFAKITPCMQNGKHAIACRLIDGFGFASTEFHVIRPTNEVLAEWIHYFIRQPAVLHEATNHFTGAVGQQRVPDDFLKFLDFPLPSLNEQQQMTAVLREQIAAVHQARAAIQAQLEAAMALPAAFVRETLRTTQTRRHLLGDCLTEIRTGVGADWSQYPVLGATRDGLAPAKEGVGKAPERYKLVDPVTVFYNPMRILLGSIAMVDEGNAAGITSPDYVAVKGRPGVLDTRWFYYWFRSAHGEHLIDSLTRGAVRERILFNRLAAGEIELPDYETQLRASERMKQMSPIVESITEELQAIDALPSAILREVFAGGV